MARNINQRLDRLRIRRSGTDRLGRLNEEARSDIIAKSRIEEAWQKRAKDKPNTRYALGRVCIQGFRLM